MPESPKKCVVPAGRNECEPFQLVLRGGDADLTGVDVEFSAASFRDGGPDIPGSNVTVCFEQFVAMSRSPHPNEGATGLWPDPLFPRTDRYTHEKRNAFPFTLRRGSNQPLSGSRVFVPEEALRGKYYRARRRFLQTGVFRALQCPSADRVELRSAIHVHASLFFRAERYRF